MPEPVRDVSLDFEVYNDISVKDVGAWRYSEHPSAEVLSLAYSLDWGPPELWLPHMGPPEELFEAFERGARFRAWNAVFDWAIWVNVQKWPEIPLTQIHCSMALAATFSYPLGLEKAGEAIGADVQKDKEGKRLLNKFATPRRPSKNDPRTRVLPEDDWDDFENLCRYNLDDVSSEMAILKRLPRRELTPREQRVFELDVLMNRRGIQVDTATAAHVKSLAQEYVDQREAEAQEVTGGIATSQRAKILEWTEEQGFALDNYQADYLKEVVAEPSMPDNVRAVVQARVALAKTSVTKYSKLLECACGDDRVRGMVQYHGAQRTGRFAGRLLQVHNLPRGTVKGIEEIADRIGSWALSDVVDWLLERGRAETRREAWDLVMEVFSSLIRSMIVADLGWDLYVTDFANIEGRVLAWMAQQLDLVRQYEQDDDVYKHMAATIFATTYDMISDDGLERFVGKQAVLGCGYGMGGSKFWSTCMGYGRDIGTELADKTVKIYRKKNRKIVSAWYDVQRAAEIAIQNPGMTTQAFMCKFRVEGDFLYVKMPSTRCLAYRDPRVEDGRMGPQITYMGVDQFSGKWVRQETYGGKLVENIVQATARDILVEAMLRTEAAGYLMLTTVHDELIATRREGEGSLKEFDALVAEVPEWARGCPIAVKGWVGKRYKKG